MLSSIQYFAAAQVLLLLGAAPLHVAGGRKAATAAEGTECELNGGVPGDWSATLRLLMPMYCSLTALHSSSIIRACAMSGGDDIQAQFLCSADHKWVRQAHVCNHTPDGSLPSIVVGEGRLILVAMAPVSCIRLLLRLRGSSKYVPGHHH